MRSMGESSSLAKSMAAAADHHHHLQCRNHLPPYLHHLHLPPPLPPRRCRVTPPELFLLRGRRHLLLLLQQPWVGVGWLVGWLVERPRERAREREREMAVASSPELGDSRVGDKGGGGIGRMARREERRGVGATSGMENNVALFSRYLCFFFLFSSLGGKRNMYILIFLKKIKTYCGL